MRKKIIINISITITIISVIVLNVFYKNIKQYNIESEASSMQITVEQIIESIKLSKDKTENVEKLFIEDYLNRAHFASFLLEDTDYENFSESKWKEILDLVEVNNIFEVNSEGTIIKSSDPESLGLNFYKEDKLKEFIPLIEGKEPDGYYVQFDGISVSLNKNMVYLGIEKSQKGGMIQIEIDPVILENYKQLSSIKELFSTVPTKEYRTLFAMNKETGELIGISKNNKQEIKVDNPVESFKAAIDNPKIITVNGEPQLAVVNEYDGNLIGYLSEISEIESLSKVELTRVFISMIFLSIVTVIVLYIILNKLVLADILRINRSANLFVRGNKNVVFEKGKTKELTELSEQLNKVIQVVETKVERISSVASLMGQGFEAYEYYADLNQLFYSKNLLNMLEYTEEECNEIVKKHFDRIRTKLKFDNDYFKEQEIITTDSGKSIKIRRTFFKNSMFAFLEDITEEKQLTENLALKLEKEKKNTYTDDLTGLYNRRKIREYITSVIKQESLLEGIVILIDLDNFKRVNDELGHLEGDILLKKFSNLLRSQFRKNDIIARLGGDEFMIFIPNPINEERLQIKLDSLISETRKALNEYYIHQRLSISMGVVCLDESFNSFEEIYKCADSAMYVTKRHGKDGFYLNKEKNYCMGENCVNCKEYCKRRKLLFGNKE